MEGVKESLTLGLIWTKFELDFVTIGKTSLSFLGKPLVSVQIFFFPLLHDIFSNKEKREQTRQDQEEEEGELKFGAS